MLAVAALIRLTSEGPGPVPADALRPERPALYALQVPLDGCRRRSARPDLEPLNEMDGAAFKIAEDPRRTGARPLAAQVQSG